jgi:hypothetical protein
MSEKKFYWFYRIKNFSERLSQTNKTLKKKNPHRDYKIIYWTMSDNMFIYRATWQVKWDLELGFGNERDLPFIENSSSHLLGFFQDKQRNK